LLKAVPGATRAPALRPSIAGAVFCLVFCVGTVPKQGLTLHAHLALDRGVERRAQEDVREGDDDVRKQ